MTIWVTRTQPGADETARRLADLGLEALKQASDLGPQPIHALTDRPRLGQHGLPGDGQPRLARALSFEKRKPQLRLEVRDAVADHRGGAIEPPPGSREAARFHHREENSELIERRRARFRHFQFLEQ